MTVPDGRRSADLVRALDDGHSLSLRGDSQANGDGELVGGVQHNIVELQAFKAITVRADRVSTGWQEQNREPSAGVAGRLAVSPGGAFDNFDVDVGHYRSALVSRDTTERGLNALCW